ncbi:[citrate (pro-3S)-lyase] ligase [Isachenkonia alkalipeptolytica]|uniref:[Citrate [pro-3S]-lyase] ligase n=1 Tax=Isachenkonia alkalipeptolytica TaxID=2565777 RepID=A0AA43XIQ2_9CLOT|nr:[citrate (pro-3S)-lyase] ligase [Isachenkonia alkalipeptolytica]NBG87166.1 [citrate (pro-3S)-lyase] ligase [Isachenkonia alkalipeptolytica]
MNIDFEITIREMNTARERKRVVLFLNEQELELERDVEYTLAVFHKDEMIGTGSLKGKVLKSIAVKQNFQGSGVTNKIVSELINEAYYRGKRHLFVYTKPENRKFFEDLGFYAVVEVNDRVCLLENHKEGIHGFVRELKREKIKGKIIGSIVMNCNPFTLGHQYLIEKAAKECDGVHVFVLWEDQSSFPSDIRYELVKKGTKHLSNVRVHRGRDYVISGATFPSYFIQGEEAVVESQASLDVTIFKEYIAPALGINRRYVGEEPFCAVTNLYNKTMEKILPQVGIEVKVIPRKKSEGLEISASMVRKGLVEQGVESVRHLVPESTYNFLLSKKAKGIIEKLGKENRRH